MTKKYNQSTKNITDTLSHLLRHHLTAFYDWESFDKAMEGIRALQVFRLSLWYFQACHQCLSSLTFLQPIQYSSIVLIWTVYDQANKYICLKSGLCWYLYASIGLFKTVKFVFKKEKNQNAIFLPFTCCSDNFRFALISKRFELCNWCWWHLKENSM